MFPLSIFGRVPRRSRRRPTCRPRRASHLHGEFLEDRRVLSILVTTLDDAGPGSLRDAIKLANNASGIETIVFAVSGTIVLTSGELQITHSMVIDGQGHSIGVNGNGASRVFNIDETLSAPDGGPESAVVTIQNLSIAGGMVPHTASSSIAGGGIRTAAILQLSNVTLSGNQAGLGGAIAVVGGGRMTGTNVTAQNNSAYYAGGAIYGDTTALLELTGSLITDNTAGMTNASNYSTVGGGIFSAGDLRLTNVTLSENAATHVVPTRGAFGGGLAIGGNGDGSLQGFDAILTSVTLDANAALGGGGMHVLSGMVDGSQLQVTGNQAGQGGGLSTAGALTLRQSTISGNATILIPDIDAAGGGVLVARGGQLVVQDGSIRNNHTTGRGGGAYVSSFGTTASTRLELQNTTVAQNSAEEAGGGVVAGSGAQLVIGGGSLEGNIAMRRGGGVYASSFGSPNATAVSITGSVLRANSAQMELGGALLLGIHVDAQILDSEIRDNRAGTRGGALYTSNFLQGAAGGHFSTVSIQGSTIADNALTATSGLALGGAIASGTNINLTIQDSTLSGNQAGLQSGVDGRGGAIYASAFGFAQTLNLDRTQVLLNRARGTVAGGLAVAQGTQAVIVDSTIDGNESAGSGGGMQVAFGSSAVVTQSTVSGNRAMLQGGGITVFDSSLDLENATISTNVTQHDGGGVWAGFNPVSNHLSIRFSTITGNVSDEDGDLAGYGGGGILVLPGSPFTLRNSIVSGNTDGSGLRPADLYDPGDGGQIGYSLIQDPSGHSAANGSDGNLVGMSAMLGSLSLSFGWTKTHQPFSGSPVLDAADPAATLTVDQRGLPRPSGSRADLGAVERQVTATPFGDFDSDGDYDCGDINALTTAVSLGSPVVPFDLNGDGLLTLADVGTWLALAGETNLGPGRAYLPGDANLDGAVDGSDFGVWNSNRFAMSSHWCDADFNADGNIDGSDFGTWNSHKFQSADSSVGHRGRMSAVPALDDPLRRGGREMGPSDAPAISDGAIAEFRGVILSQRSNGERGTVVGPTGFATQAGHGDVRGNQRRVEDRPATAETPFTSVQAWSLVLPRVEKDALHGGRAAAPRGQASRAIFDDIFASWNG